MGLQCGIVGLPNVGKSTLFNCLSNAKAQAANFPFCTIEPNIGVINVPDPRLTALADLVNPQRIVPNTIEIVDIAGLVEGASKGEGLGNQFLSNIRDVNAIIHVIRCFEDENVTHVHGQINPVRDKEVIDLELQFKDFDTVDKRISRIERQAKSGDKAMLKQYDALVKVKKHLEAGKSVRSLELTADEKEVVAELNLLTIKPVMYVANVDEESLQGNAHVDALREAIKDENAELLILSAKIESEIIEITDPEERKDYLDMYGLEEPGVNRLIRTAYKLLNLITYFTAGVKEVRAWPVKAGSTAPEAAAVIHTDFQKGFIRAEVIKLKDYMTLKSEAACKEAGKLSIEGKEYIVTDGDVMHFRFNV